MSKIRVHELASAVGRQNKEVIEFLKQSGMNVKSHMSTVDDLYVKLVKDKFLDRGKEPIAKVDTPKTEEKVMTAQAENSATEAPKKKKNIIRVYHAQNASDGGKTSKPNNKRPSTEKKPAVKTQAAPAPKAETAPVQKPVEAEVKKVETAPVQAEAPKTEAPKTEAPRQQSAGNNGREFRDGNRGGD